MNGLRIADDLVLPPEAVTTKDRGPKTSSEPLRFPARKTEQRAAGQRPSCIADPLDVLDDVDDGSDDDREPEDLADPSCVECGGQGGWCGDFSPSGLCIWVTCFCVEESDD